jgi:hypothetical protein
VTGQLGRYGADSSIHQLQENEHEYLVSGTPYPGAPEVYLIRYDLDAAVIDTVAVLAGPPIREQGRRGTRFQPPLRVPDLQR